MNTDIWVIGTLNQLFVRGSYNEIKFSKNKVVSGKTPLFVIGPFCNPHSICLNSIRNFVWKCDVFHGSTFN